MTVAGSCCSDAHMAIAAAPPGSCLWHACCRILSPTHVLQEELPNADQDAKARDAMYERAEGLGTTLSRMGEQLRTAIHSVNDAAYASQVGLPLLRRDRTAGSSVLGRPLQLATQHHSRCGSLCSDVFAGTASSGRLQQASMHPKADHLQGETPTALDKVVRIINSQLQALTSIDRRTDDLEASLQSLKGREAVVQ